MRRIFQIFINPGLHNKMQLQKYFIFILFLLVWGNKVTSEKNKNTFGFEEQSQSNPLGLFGNQFWNNPEIYIEDIIGERLMSSIDGYIIDAPVKVLLHEHETVPLVCVHTAETNKFLRHSLKTTAQLLSVHLETGEIQLVKLAPTPAVRDTRKHPPGFSSQSLIIDLKEKLSIHQFPGHHTLKLLCGVESSNTDIVEVVPYNFKNDLKEYIKICEKMKNEKQMKDVSGVYSQYQIKHLDRSVQEGNGNVLNLEYRDEEKAVVIDFKIEGIHRFLSAEEKKYVDPNGNVVYAGLPIAVIGFDEERTLTIFEKITLPVTSIPTMINDVPVFSGSVLLPLQDIVDLKECNGKISLWFVTMEYVSVIEVFIDNN